MSGIVVLPSVIFPNDVVVAGVSGTLSRKNVRNVNQGGFGSVTAVNDVTMRAWQIGIAPMLASLAEEVFGSAEATDFGAFGMLFLDPVDSQATLANGALQGYMLGVQYGAPGFGNGCPTYGIGKFYTARGSSVKRFRQITRPIGTPDLTRGGGAVSIGVGAGDAGFSVAPVYATFVADATRTIPAVALGASTQVTLSTAIPGFVVGGRLWLQGFTGADAALLNNQSHQITAIAGAVYTLATVTTGKAITVGAAQGHKYPQPDEALGAAFRFYVPVNFRSDEIEWELAIAGPRDSRYVVIPSTYLDEIREA